MDFSYFYAVCTIHIAVVVPTLMFCLPTCSSLQLLTSGAVRRWGPEIQEGIYNMLQLLVDLVTAALQHETIPVNLMYVLAQVRKITVSLMCGHIIDIS